MAFRVPVRDYMMNLQSICASTNDASMIVSLESHTPHILPFAYIGGRFPPSPKMAFLSSMRTPLLDASMFPTTALSFFAKFRLELLSAYCAFSHLRSSVSPPGCEIACRVAINGLAGFSGIKLLSAIGADSHSASLSLWAVFLFWLFSFGFVVTGTTTKYRFPGRRRLKLFSALVAYLCDFRHALIITQKLLKCTYFQLAVRNLRTVEAETKMPSLFDMAMMETEAA